MTTTLCRSLLPNGDDAFSDTYDGDNTDESDENTEEEP